MWWGWHSHGDYRAMKGWSVALIILGIVLLTGRMGGPIPWMILFFFVIPMVMRVLNAGATRQKETYKRKRYGDDVVIIDKPKREPQYAVGDDGELVEVYADDLYEEKPKRRQSDDDLEYI